MTCTVMVLLRVSFPGKPRLALAGPGINSFLSKQLSPGGPVLEEGVEELWVSLCGLYTHPLAVKPGTTQLCASHTTPAYPSKNVTEGFFPQHHDL